MKLRGLLILRGLLWLAAILIALKLRLIVVGESQSSAGDGIQYYQLSQVLRLEHRFAYSPGAPLTFTRLPGYPLFLALLAPGRPIDLATHLIMATRANALLDVGSALVVAAMARRLGMGMLAQLLGFGAVVVSPPMLMLSTFGLSESLVTFLLTLAVYLALRVKDAPTSAHKRRSAIAAGILLGLSQLIRVDALLVIPSLLMLFGLLQGSWQKRLSLMGLCLGLAALTFAPWPLRNLRLFRATYAGGVPWIDQEGVPLRLGMMRWYQTWATGRQDGEGFDLFLVARHAPLPPSRPNVITPVMYEDERERQRLAALFDKYCREGLSPAVDQQFYRLAWQRFKHRPFRILVELPLVRLKTLWSPMPTYEMGIHSTLLRLPEERERWDRFGSLLLLLSVAGVCFALSEPHKRRWVLALVLIPIVRSVAFVYLHPIPLQRYFVEAMPVLLLFSGYALAWPIDRLCELLSVLVNRSSTSEPSL